jgi:uncharacterized protein
MIVVSDTSPIANLAIVNHIHLLPDLFGQIIVPEVVFKELLANGKNHLVTQIVQSAPWIEVYSIKNLEVVKALAEDCSLDLGEAHAIVLATELQAHQLLIDERMGRAEAQRRGLSIIGILGVLLLAKQRDMIVAVKPVMDDLVNRANFRLRPTLYREVLKLADES